MMWVNKDLIMQITSHGSLQEAEKKDAASSSVEWHIVGGLSNARCMQMKTAVVVGGEENIRESSKTPDDSAIRSMHNVIKDDCGPLHVLYQLDSPHATSELFSGIT
jgi:hypothetical protein